jgi:hypothetical protein
LPSGSNVKQLELDLPWSPLLDRVRNRSDQRTRILLGGATRRGNHLVRAGHRRVDEVGGEVVAAVGGRNAGVPVRAGDADRISHRSEHDHLPVRRHEDLEPRVCIEGAEPAL